jgi:hypothetical protein
VVNRRAEGDKERIDVEGIPVQRQTTKFFVGRRVEGRMEGELKMDGALFADTKKRKCAADGGKQEARRCRLKKNRTGRLEVLYERNGSDAAGPKLGRRAAVQEQEECMASFSLSRMWEVAKR